MLGIAAAGFVARMQRDEVTTTRDQRFRLTLAAVGGAILGAYLLELPADLLGWSAPAPAGGSGDDAPLGGRTVLGGILGAWLAVEAIKPRLAIRFPTGDAFALPLAIALAFGRTGCLLAGCCAGVECSPSALAWNDLHGTPRVPVQAIEILFHGLAAGALFVAAKRRAARGRRLAIYVTGYAALRFALEFWRPHPRVIAGLSWYQVLAIALASLGAVTWWRRRRA